MSKDQLIPLTRQTASDHNLVPELVCAICEQESTWDPFAIRYEPAFMSKYVAPLFTNNKIDATEAYARAMSWGLMQVMGQVARELGFHGRFLAELSDAAVGLSIGCLLLQRKLAAAEGSISNALLLWNGGANPNYPSEVLARISNYSG